MKRPPYVDIIESELAANLGARPVTYNERVTLFIAHRDKDGNAVPEVAQWVTRAETVLSRIGGGATSLEARGAWLGDRQLPLHEPTTLVYTYADPAEILRHVGELKRFALEYGRETMQGEVAILLENPDGDWFFRIPLSA